MEEGGGGGEEEDCWEWVAPTWGRTSRTITSDMATAGEGCGLEIF